MSTEAPSTLDATFTLTLTPEDCDILSEMQRAGGHGSFDAVLAQALYQYAQHLDIGPIPARFMACAVLAGRKRKGEQP